MRERKSGVYQGLILMSVQQDVLLP